MSTHNEGPSITDPYAHHNDPRLPQQQNLPNATAVLVLGIISIVGCFCYGLIGLITGIIALVLAKKDRARYNINPNMFTEGSYKNLNAGRVCAIIGTILSSLYILIVIGYLSIIGTAILSNPAIFLDR